MKLHVIKKNGQFVIPALEHLDIDLEGFIVEVDTQTAAQLKSKLKKSTVQQLHELNEALGGDPYLTLKLTHLPPDYHHLSCKSDDELLAEALQEKYGK